MHIDLTGETRVFPIIGDPIGQVKSPTLLTELMMQRGINGLVVPAHVAAGGLAAFIGGMKQAQNCGGMIVTVPHKPAALAHCDRLTERARHAGSANVLARQDDGTWLGDNIDGLGYVDGIEGLGQEVRGNRALLVGVGGAGAAIAYELLARGVAHLALHDIDGARLDGALSRLDAAFPGKVSRGSADPTGFDLVCNATPVGMRESDPLPIDAGQLTGREFVADSITKPEVTPLLIAAMTKGCATMPGLGMFTAQADALIEILTTGKAP